MHEQLIQPKVGVEPSRVVNDTPLTAHDRAAFLLLTGLATAALLAFLVYVPWINPENPSLALVVFIPFMLFHFACWLIRWLAIWRMRRPRPMVAAQGLRVAVATTFVPAAEPLGMLEQRHRHLHDRRR